MYEYERVHCQKPKGCRDCEYHQARWRYRSCYFVRCPYGLRDTTFRSSPLEKENFPQKEVVKMSDV